MYVSGVKTGFLSSVVVNNGVSDRITLNTDGTSSFLGNMGIGSQTVTANQTVSGNQTITGSQTVNANQTVASQTVTRNQTVNGVIYANDTDFRSGNELYIGRSGIFPNNINIGNAILASTFVAPNINIYGKLNLNDAETLITNFAQF
jgi:hypothetical protein